MPLSLSDSSSNNGDFCKPFASASAPESPNRPHARIIAACHRLLLDTSTDGQFGVSELHRQFFRLSIRPYYNSFRCGNSRRYQLIRNFHFAFPADTVYRQLPLPRSFSAFFPEPSVAGPDSRNWEPMNLKRANSEQLAPPQGFADHFRPGAHNRRMNQEHRSRAFLTPDP
jgi:hypothetical protein